MESKKKEYVEYLKSLTKDLSKDLLNKVVEDLTIVALLNAEPKKVTDEWVEKYLKIVSLAQELSNLSYACREEKVGFVSVESVKIMRAFERIRNILEQNTISFGVEREGVIKLIGEIYALAENLVKGEIILQKEWIKAEELDSLKAGKLEIIIPKKEEAEKKEKPLNWDELDKIHYETLLLGLEKHGGEITIAATQRALLIGYARAGGIMDKLESCGFITTYERKDGIKRVINVTLRQVKEQIAKRKIF